MTTPTREQIKALAERNPDNAMRASASLLAGFIEDMFEPTMDEMLFIFKTVMEADQKEDRELAAIGCLTDNILTALIDCAVRLNEDGAHGFLAGLEHVLAENHHVKHLTRLSSGKDFSEAAEVMSAMAEAEKEGMH